MKCLATIQASLFKTALSELKKFLGSKAGPIKFSVVKGVLKIQQNSDFAASIIDLKISSLKGRLEGVFVDQEWLASSVKQAGANVEVSLLFDEFGLKIEWGNQASKSSYVESIENFDIPEAGVEYALPEDLLDFLRNNSRVFDLKTFFTEQSATATIGYLRKRPFIMVNDEYHGIIAIGKKSLGRMEQFSLNAEAMKAMTFDPKSVEGSIQKAELFDGRLVLTFRNMVVILPTYEPSIIPTLEEIQGTVSLMDKQPESCAALPIPSLIQAISVSARGKEDATQSFSIQKKDRQLHFIYSSNSVDSKGFINVGKFDWKHPVSVDPDMLNDVVTIISLILPSKSAKDAVCELKKSGDNILAITVNDEHRSLLGFLIVSDK